MPATYAAVTASLNALSAIRPDFAPASLLDVGAGPGTASWAAAEAFASLRYFTLLDANAALRALALDLVRDSARLRDLDYIHRDARAALADAPAADLVVASYVIGEIGDGERSALAALMWAKVPRHAADRRARHAGGLCRDHRAAPAADRRGRPCRSPPARTTASVR